METPIFLVEKPSTETTAMTFSISGIQAQHEQVAMATHSVTTETRYIHVYVPIIKQKSNYMYINGNIYDDATEMPPRFWRGIHKKEPEQGQVPVATFRLCLHDSRVEIQPGLSYKRAIAFMCVPS